MTQPANFRPNAATFTRTTRDGWQVVTITGELDMASAPGLTEQLTHAIIARTPPLVAVEVSRLEFCDTSGLREMIVAWKRIRIVDGRFVVLNPTGRFSDLLRRTALDQRFEIAAALPQAPA